MPLTADALASPLATRRGLETAADLPALLERLGSVPAERVRFDPFPGTGTWEDVDRVRRETGKLCELIDGTLVEKAVSDWTGYLGLRLGSLLMTFVLERKLGVCHGSDGFFHFGGDLRAPDISYTPKERRRGGLLRHGYSDMPPTLVVEVLSPGNTQREMALKRRTYFAHDVVRVWEVGDGVVTVWEGLDASVELRGGQTLTGEPVLPGFAIAVDDLFEDPLAEDDAPS
ncbi:Uma2 family endonuclease [Alienimonas sp. DA493]|uniref:Uma2 family endonuclease n=1 Tax=Alienimonas sp. DA493 TaxID=3373605 RepID=UPI003753FB6B